jgi:cytosine/adenosine deaminase-related metal-dependent hydrolase
MGTLIVNALYLSNDFKSFTNGEIYVEDGLIKKLGKFKHKSLNITHKFDGSKYIIIPGLINSHSHSYTSFLKGTINNVPLDIYMLHAFAGNTERSEREIYVSTVLEGLQLLKFGVTTNCDHFMMRPVNTIAGWNAAAKAYRDCGMRANIAPQFSDLPFTDTVPFLKGELPFEFKSKPTNMKPNEYFEMLKNAVDKYNKSDDIKFLVGVDGPQRCTHDLMKQTAAFELKYKVGWYTHILESKTQAVSSYKKYGKGLIEYINELGLLTERTSFVHYVWANEIERKLVLDNKVNIVHCPSSNLHLGSGITPVDQLINDGNKVAIGTDGGNSGNLNVLENIRLTARLHNVANPDYETWLTPDTALRMAYENGAKVALRNNIGKIKEGFKADLVFIDINNILWQPTRNLLNQLVFSESGQNIKHVMVNGKFVIKNGISTKIDETALISEAKIMTSKIIKATKKNYLNLKKQLPYFKKMYLREIKKDIGFNRFSRTIKK